MFATIDGRAYFTAAVLPTAAIDLCVFLALP
jgi:hypothetical protein